MEGDLLRNYEWWFRGLCADVCDGLEGVFFLEVAGREGKGNTESKDNGGDMGLGRGAVEKRVSPLRSSR